ncbi:MAG: carbohydrate-binding protein [Bacteroidota bacterium]
MKRIKIIIAALAMTMSMPSFSQSVNYTQSWMGNTYGGKTWVQDMIDYMEVDSDGTVYAYTGWDEGSGGARKGTYKDGLILANHNRNISFKQVTDNDGNTWSINREGDVSIPFEDKSISCSDGRKITDVVNPMALAIAKNGMLMVGEYGPRQQILYYDISGNDTPTLDHTFGEEFGTNSGVPGIVAPLKLREITGVGEDDAGNIYVSHNSFFSGCKLESYNPDGELNWWLDGLVFVDNGDFDPTTDGKDIYTKNHHFAMDYSKEAGKQWKDSAYTINRFKYPDDARLHPEAVGTAPTIHPSSAWIRYKDDHKIMIVNDMYSDQIRLYRFNFETDGEIAIPSGLYAKHNLKPYLFNFNQFKFDDDEFILATSYTDKRGTIDEPSNVAYIQDGCYLAYSNVDFGTGKTSISASTSCPGYGGHIIGGTIELRADSLNGRIIGSVTTGITGSWGTYELYTSDLSDTITGIHQIYLHFKYPKPERWPATQPDYGEWLWTDLNGDGQMDEGEYQTSGVEVSSVGGFWVDNALNIWRYGTTIVKIPCTGLDSHGNPSYAFGAQMVDQVPSTSVITGDYGKGNIEYDSDNDVMYLLTSNGDGTAGYVSKYSSWDSGNRTADWKISTFGSQSMCTAGDYLFTINGKDCKVYIYALSDGKFIGRMDPTGPIGWIDIPYGIRATRRSNGEYVVVTEEDSKGKLLLFRFSSLNPNQIPVVNITTPTADQEIASAASISVIFTATDPDGWIEKTLLFIDDILVSDKMRYSWLDASPGDHTIFARAFDNYGDSTTSEIIEVKITVTGINSNLSLSSVKIYPNPATDKIHIEASDKMSGVANITIIDSQGQVIVTKEVLFVNGGNSEIDVSGIANGIHILKVRSGNAEENLKLIIYD